METFTNEINLRLSQETDSMMSMMQSQINRAISSAIAERVITEIQNMVRLLSSGNRDTESVLSSNDQENSDGTAGFKSKITKKASDLRDTEDLSPYTYLSENIMGAIDGTFP